MTAKGAYLTPDWGVIWICDFLRRNGRVLFLAKYEAIEAWGEIDELEKAAEDATSAEQFMEICQERNLVLPPAKP